MDEVQIRHGREVIKRPSKRVRPGRVHAFEASVHSGDTHHVRREGEELIQLLPRVVQLPHSLREEGPCFLKSASTLPHAFFELPVRVLHPFRHRVECDREPAQLIAPADGDAP